eukprot:COSAG05_NODE_2688_length_2769_cov_4.603371_3_plen_168_part_00
MHEIMKLNRSKSACRIHWGGTRLAGAVNAKEAKAFAFGQPEAQRAHCHFHTEQPRKKVKCQPCHDCRQIRVRFHIIRNERIENVGKSWSRMVFLKCGLYANRPQIAVHAPVRGLVDLAQRTQPHHVPDIIFLHTECLARHVLVLLTRVLCVVDARVPEPCNYALSKT